VPAGAAPGDYSVTLTAALPNGQKRTGVGVLTVLPAASPPDVHDSRAPVASLAIRAERLGKLITSRKLRVDAKLDEPGVVALSWKVGGHAVTATLNFTKAGGRAAVLRIGKQAAKALRRRSRLLVTVKASARDLAGNTTVARGARTLKR
jgi:hypothetical protein